MLYVKIWEKDEFAKTSKIFLPNVNLYPRLVGKSIIYLIIVLLSDNSIIIHGISVNYTHDMKKAMFINKNKSKYVMFVFFSALKSLFRKYERFLNVLRRKKSHIHLFLCKIYVYVFSKWKHLLKRFLYYYS